MAQQWLTTAVRETFRDRDDTRAQAAEAARVRRWLEALPLERAVVAAVVEPLAALEDGLRLAAADAAGGGSARSEAR